MAVTVADLEVVVGADTKGAEKGLNSVNKKVKHTASDLIGVGSVFTGVGVGIASMFTKSIMAGADWEFQLDAIQSTLGATDGQMNKLNKTLLNVATTGSFSTMEIGAATEELAKSGMAYEDIMNGGIQATSDFAAATGTDLIQSSEIVGEVMNTMGVDATTAADTVTAALNVSSMSAQDWQMAFKQAGPVAVTFGEDTTGMAAVLSLLADSGIKAETAGTAYRNMLLGLANPTTETTELLDGMGVSTKDAQGNFRGFGPIMNDLAGKWSGLTDSQKANLAQTIAGKDGMASFMAIMEAGPGAVDEYAKSIEGSTSANQQAQDRMDNLKGSIEQLKGAFEAAMIIVGQKFAPAVRVVVDAVTGLIESFMGLPSGVQEAIIVFGVLVGGLALVAAALAAATLAGGAFTAVMGVIASPVFLVVAAIAALGAGFVLAYKHIGPFRNAVDAVFALIKKGLGVVKDLAKLAGKGLAKGFDKLTDAIKPVAELIGKGLSKGIEAVANGFHAAVDAVKAGADALTAFAFEAGFVDAALGFLQTALNGVSAFIATVKDAVQSVTDAFGEGGLLGALKALPNALSTIGSAFLTLGSTILNGLVTAIQSIDWNMVRTTIVDGLKSAVSGISVAMDWVLDTGIPNLLGWITTAAGNMWNALKSLAGWASDNVSGAINLTLDVLSSLAETALSGLSSAKDWLVSKLPWLEGPLNAAGEAITGAINLAMNVAGTISDTLGEAWSSLTSLISSVASWLVAFFGIGEDGSTTDTTKSATSVFSFIVNILGSIFNFLGDAWSSIKNLISSAASWLVDFFGIGEDGNANTVNKTASGRFSFVMNILGTIFNVLGDAWSSVTGVINSAAGWLVDFFGIGDTGDAGGLVTKYASASFSFAFEILGKIANGLGDAWTSIKSVVNSVGGWIADFFGIGDDGVGEAVTKTASATLELAADIAGNVTDNLDGAWDSTKDLVGSIAGGAKDLVTDTWGGVNKTVNSTVDFVVTVSGKVVDGLGAALGWLGLGGGGEESGDGGTSAVTTIDTAIQNIVSAIESGLQDILNAINGWDSSQIGTAINDKVVEGVNGLSGENIGAGITSWLDRSLATVVTGLVETGRGLAVMLDTTVGMGFASMSGTSLSSSITAWFGRAMTPVGASLVTFGTAFGSLVNGAFVAGIGQLSGASLGGAITVWLGRAMTPVGAKLPSVGTSFAGLLSTAFVGGINGLSGASLGAAMSAWISRGFTTSKRVITTFTNDTLATLRRWGNEVDAVVNHTVDDVTSTIRQGTAEGMRSFSTFASDARSTIRQVMSDIRRAVRQGMSDATGAIRGDAREWAGIISSAGGHAASTAFGVGQNIGSSLGRGLASTVGYVAAQANRLIAQVDRAMRARARIHSPSKMTDYFGRMLGQGLVGGMDSTLKQVARAGDRLAVASLIKPSQSWAPMPAYASVPVRDRGSQPVVVHQTNHYTVQVDDLADLNEAIEFVKDLPTERDLHVS